MTQQMRNSWQIFAVSLLSDILSELVFEIELCMVPRQQLQWNLEFLLNRDH